MLFFGHAGLTAGVSYLASRLKMRKIDYRFILIGALLPDIIDKPLGLIVLNYGNGRMIAHTLVFALLLTAAAFYKKDMRLYALSGGTWMHLLLDSMWLFPVTLLWPLLGNFQRGIHTIGMIPASINQPLVFASEIIGIAILLCIAVKNKMYKKSNLIRFFKTGYID